MLLRVALVALAVALPARAQEVAPPPGEPDANPPPVEAPAPDGAGDDDDGAPPPIPVPDDGGEPEFVPKPAPPPDAPSEEDDEEPGEGGLFGGACIGSSVGCLGAGCLPATGTALGGFLLASFISAGIEAGGLGGACLAVVGISGGVVIGAPSAILLGPCASGGATAGGVVGALADDRDVGPVLLGALPGIVTALLGTGGAIWGLAVLGNSSGDYTLPVVLLGTGTLLAVASGPLTIAGITVADGLASPADEEAEPSARPPKKARDPDEDEGRTQVAMRY